MSYPINYPTPQGANIQMFSEGSTTSDWIKPQGASFVWFTLIGGGGWGADVGNQISGGSGAVTNFMCPAFLIPDMLRVNVGRAGRYAGNIEATASSIVYQQKNTTGYTLLTADFGKNGFNASGVAGSAMTANAFTAMGFFQSIAGQDGVAIGSAQGASATTFLSGGSGSGSVTGNYGYSITQNNNGFFMLQPIIVGLGGSGSSSNGRGGNGCGGNASGVSVGGDGLVVIITW
jgi:hypothetical protein